MKLIDVKDVHVASFKELVEMFDALVEQINTLTEAVIPVNPDLDMEQQLAELTKRMEAARRGLGLVNKFPAGPQRTEHRRRIMGNLNTIRAMLGRVLKAQEQFNSAEQGYEAGSGYAQDFGRRAVGENDETWNDNRWEKSRHWKDDEEVCPDCEMSPCECEVDHGDGMHDRENEDPEVYIPSSRGRRAMGESYGRDPQGPRPTTDRNGKIIKRKRPYTKDEKDDIGDKEYQYRKENPKDDK